MARVIDRSNLAHAEAVLAALVPDPKRRDAILRALGRVAAVAADLHPASWSITLQHNLIQLNVGQILVFQLGRENVTLAGYAGAMDDSPLRDMLRKSNPFAVIAGVVLYTIPHGESLELAIQALLPGCLDVTRQASRSRGPWRKAHSPGVVPLLERSLGHSLAWEAPDMKTTISTYQGPSTQDIEHTIQAARAALPAARIARRSQALDQAKLLILQKLGAFTEPDLRRLLQLFNHDWTSGHEVLGRFSTGLVGNNAHLLVAQLGNVNTAMPQLWQADDAWISEHLAGLRHGGTLPGGGWLFPTMLLHTRDPSRFLPMTKSLAEGLATLDGGLVVSMREGAAYLDYCKRVHALLTEHDISPHGADVLLWHGAALAGVESEAAPDEPIDAPQGKAPTVSPSTEPAAPVVAPDAIHVTPTVAPILSVKAQTPTEEIPVLQAPPPTPTAPGKPASIGWLHLTDLHQGMSSSNWLWPNVLAMTFDDLMRLHDVSGPWDIIFFTGDLTQRGTAQEFAELDRTLDRLWKRLEQLGSRPCLITVPGNHDLARPDPFDPVVLALSLWHKNRGLRDRVLGAEDNPYIVRLREAFAAYTAWTQRAPWFVREGVTRGLMPGDLAASLKLHGLDVGIVALNSAFLQLTGANFHEQLDVDARQLHQVCGHYAPQDFGKP